VNTDPYAVTAAEQAAQSRRLEALVSSAAGDRTIDLTDGASASSDDAVEARLAAIEDTLDGLAERFEALTRDTASDAGAHFSALESRLERLHTAVVEGFGAELSSLRHDLADALDEVRGQVESTVGVASSEVKSGLAEMSRSLTGQFAAIRGVTGTLGGGTDRLVGAGQALLAYLGERDQWLERERDRMLHDVLDEFAQGLSGRGRRSLSSRMRNVVDRRRDARDAERFRHSESATTVIEIPSMPAELAVLSEPIAAPPSAGPAAYETDEDSFTVVPALKKTPAPRNKPAAKATAAKTTTKKVAIDRIPTAQTGAKKATARKPRDNQAGAGSAANR
jgi:hypothetical protein